MQGIFIDELHIPWLNTNKNHGFTTFFTLLAPLGLALNKQVLAMLIYSILKRIKAFKGPIAAMLLGFITSIPQSHAQKAVRDSLINQITAKRAIPDFNAADSLYISSMIRLAVEMRYYNLDSLRLLAQEVMELGEEENNTYGRSNAHWLLGNFNSLKGRHQMALTHYNTALKLSNEVEDDRLQLKILNDMGYGYESSDDYASALSSYLDALDLATQKNDLNMLSIINENIANLYLSQEDFDQAMYFYEKAKHINEKIGNPIFMAETMSNMAGAYTDMGKLDYAMFNVNSAISIFEKSRIIDWLAYCYEIKGSIYLKEKNYKWAMYWYKQSEQLHEGLEDLRGEIDLLNGIAKTTFFQEKDTIAQNYAEKAYTLSKKMGLSSGIKESSETLYNLYKNSGDYVKALEYHEIYKSISDTIMTKKSEKGLMLLKTKVKYDQQKEELIAQNERALAKQRMYIYIAVGILLIFVGITFLVKRNERIQKALNKALLAKTTDLEKSQAHLQEVNRTKIRLFSIIGHDLRGPIGAIQNLLQLFNEGNLSNEELMKFIPKLRKDINNISFTLNNLLSWGNSQMNGYKTKAVEFDLRAIVKENIALLSEISSGKSIEISNLVQEGTLVWSDSDQIDIVVRNLISNALKFTPFGGKITVSAKEKNTTWEICVGDTGVGMDQRTLDRLFSETPHTTYGTNEEKGTGLGLSLCKEMVEKNKGTIWVKSTPNVGSNFYFSLPKLKREYKNTA